MAEPAHHHRLPSTARTREFACEAADPQAKGADERLQASRRPLRARPPVRQRRRLPGAAQRTTQTSVASPASAWVLLSDPWVAAPHRDPFVAGLSLYLAARGRFVTAFRSGVARALARP